MRKLYIGRAIKFFKAIIGSSSKRIIYAGGYPSYPNLGDVTLYAAYKKLFSPYEFVHYEGGRLSKIPSKMIGVGGHAMLGGGTLINRQSLHPATECSEIFKKFYVFGTGVTQASFWSKTEDWEDSMHLWKPILDGAEYVGVRGPLSLKTLQDNNIKAEMIGDPVLIYAKEEDVEKIEFQKKTIGINIGGSEGKIWGSEETVAEKYEQLARKLKAEGFEVHWFVVWGKDWEIVRKLSVFIGLKLHAVVMAHCQYVPSIMIEYRPKCLDYMMSVNHEDYNYSSDEFQVEKVFNQLLSMDEKRLELSKILYKEMRVVCDRQKIKAGEILASWKA
jgi:hypothetical protein